MRSELFRLEEQTQDRFQKAGRVILSVVGLLVLGAAAGIFASRYGKLALVVSGFVMGASFLLLKDRHENIFSTHRWIPYAWVALCLVPDFRFTFRSTLDNSVSSATPENFTQVAVYVLVAVLVLHSRRLLVTGDPRHLRTGPFLAWPLLALLSTAWSLVPLFTLIRALQLFVPIGLALVMVRIWMRAPDEAHAMWKRTLRLFVQAVTILILVGLATGLWRDARFTWPGTHPGTSAIYVGTALLALVAGGRSFLGFRPVEYGLRVVLFGTALYMGDTRGALAGLLVAFGVGLWFAARSKPLKSYLGLMYFALAIGLVSLAALPEIMQYALRGGEAEGIATLNGRIPLWTEAISVLDDANKWLMGFGYGSARVILPTYVDWAGTAHSSWVELLMSMGIIGPLLLAADIAYVLFHASRRNSFMPSSVTVSILVLLVVTSITGEALIFPGISFVLVAFLHTPVLAERNVAADGVGVGRVRESVVSGHPSGHE